jgi:hypothetical protein
VVLSGLPQPSSRVFGGISARWISDPLFGLGRGGAIRPQLATHRWITTDNLLFGIQTVCPSRNLSSSTIRSRTRPTGSTPGECVERTSQVAKRATPSPWGNDIIIHPGEQFAQISCPLGHLAGPLTGLPILQGSRGHVQAFFKLLLAQPEPLSRLKEGQVVTLISVLPSVGLDVPCFQELPQVRPIESPLSLGEPPTSDHCSHAECKIRRIARRVDQQLRHSALSQRDQCVLDRSVRFRVRQIQKAHSGLCEGCHFVARDGLEFGEYGAKRDLASANDFCGVQTTSSLDSTAVHSNGIHDARVLVGADLAHSDESRLARRNLFACPLVRRAQSSAFAVGSGDKEIL